MTVREQAHTDAVRLTTANLATKLQNTLGQAITAYAVGVADPRTVGKWAAGKHEPRKPEQLRRLQDLFVITQILLSRETAEVVRAWMIGSHPLLEDHAPLELLHDENVAPVDRAATVDSRAHFRAVVSAAEDFVSASG